MQIWSIVSIKLALKFNWKISRNTSLFKENYIISLSENNIIGQGEVAFNIRYGESKESILEEFAWFCEQYNYKRVFNRNDLIWLEECKQISASLKMGINQAFYNFLCKKENISIEDILEVERPEAVISSFSIPILPEIDLADFLLRYNLLNYPFLKIKINGLKSVPLVNKLLSCYQGMIRIDANEGFYDYQEVLNFIKRISQISKIDFIEQPLPARLNHEMIYLKGKCGVEFIADESITYDEDLSKLSLYFDGVNIKLMKSGTIRNAKKQLEKAKKLGLKTMLGCMIETSLGISFAYSLAKDVDYLDLDGFILIEDEPFQLLNEDKGLISLKV